MENEKNEFITAIIANEQTRKNLQEKKNEEEVRAARPDKRAFIRTNANHQFDGAILESLRDGIYLVKAEIVSEVEREAGGVVFKRFYGYVDQLGVYGLWPIKLPSPEIELDSWNASAHEIAKRAESSWVRVQANQRLGKYEARVSELKLGEPKWTELPFAELVFKAFADKVIDSLSHPIVLELKGVKV